jgi:hypothetical protein
MGPAQARQEASAPQRPDELAERRCARDSSGPWTEHAFFAYYGNRDEWPRCPYAHEYSGTYYGKYGGMYDDSDDG